MLSRGVDMESDSNKNEIVIIGKVISNPVYSHNHQSREFYKMDVRVLRNSGTADDIPVIFNNAITRARIRPEERIMVKARISSRDEKTALKTKHRVFLSATAITGTSASDMNEAIIEGYICTPPYYRIVGSRELTTFMLASNNCRKSYYIPIVTWGYEARDISGADIGTRLCISGRFQSRRYIDSDFNEQTAYEISVHNLTKF